MKVRGDKKERKFLYKWWAQRQRGNSDDRIEEVLVLGYWGDTGESHVGVRGQTRTSGSLYKICNNSSHSVCNISYCGIRVLF